MPASAPPYAFPASAPPAHTYPASAPPGSPWSRPGQAGYNGHNGHPGQAPTQPMPGHPPTFATTPISTGAPYGGPTTGGPYGPTTGAPYGPTTGAPYGPPPGYAAYPVQPVAQRGSRVPLLAVGAIVLALVSAFGGGLVANKLADDDQATASNPTVVTQNPAPNLDRSSVGGVAEAVLPSVVDISTGEAEGSGVIMTADGQVITNNHVVAGAKQLTVTFRTGKTASATVVGTDPAGDIAVIKIQGVSGLTPAKFGDSDALRVGDTVLAVGSPLGLQGSVTAGIVSALHRTISGEEGGKSIADAIQTDAAINPGNSGGALVNAAGQVIGINTAIASVASSAPGQQSQQSGNIGVGFAIPSSSAERIAKEIIETGSATHAVLGVSAQTASDGSNPEVGSGAEVVQVQAGSAAADAGLQAGDVITALGDRPVTSSTDLTAAVRSIAPGTKVTLTVHRGSDTEKVEVALGTSTS
jgi:putative serine protease PepD